MSMYEMVRPFLEVLAIGFLVMVVYLGMPSRLKERLADIWKAIGLPLKAFLPWLAIGIAPIALWFVIRESRSTLEIGYAALLHDSACR